MDMPQGWRLTIAVALLLTLASLILLLLSAGSAESVREVIRFTARTSLVLFLLAYGASALVKLWKQPWSLWLRRNRRYIGVSFAASHLIHGLAIIALTQVDPSFELAPITLILGGLAYIFIALMAATSFDVTARAIGPRAWAALHSVGSFYVWATFLSSFSGRASMSRWYLLPVFLLVAVMLVRIVARFRHRFARA